MWLAQHCRCFFIILTSSFNNSSLTLKNQAFKLTIVGFSSSSSPDDTVGKGYLLYKIFLALFWLIIVVIDLVRNSLRTFSVSQGAKYLLYLTRYVVSGLFLLLSKGCDQYCHQIEDAILRKPSKIKLVTWIQQELGCCQTLGSLN